MTLVSTVNYTDLTMHMQTLAEKEAWKLAKKHGLDMVAVLPNFVLGPVISVRNDGTSVGYLKVPSYMNRRTRLSLAHTSIDI